MLELDCRNCHAERIGTDHGLDAGARTALADALRGALDQLAAGADFGGQRWRGLCRDERRAAHVTAIRALVDRLPGTRDLVVLGIGGSALGNIALHSALNPSTWNDMDDDARGGPRLWVLDNVDPTRVADVFDLIAARDPAFDHTIINVISKSGETAETAAQFMIARERVRAARGDRFAERFVAITDAERGTMRSICDRDGLTTLPVPDGVGGRFSVLSPVGLFSAAMCGIDIDALLDGATAMDDACRQPTLETNPAAELGGTLVAFMQRGKPIHVMMPYANALYDLADWYRQLWAESLGKRVDRSGREVWVGPTPVKALGTTDQHSQVQLYREGPNDKVVGFLEVQSMARDVTIPTGMDVDALRYLEGASLGTLLNAEKRATEFALVESRRPNFTIRFPRIDAFHVGAFIQLWELATAVAGELLEIDAFDQPAVETGKQATFGLMGRAGYESWRDRVDDALGAARA